MTLVACATTIVFAQGKKSVVIGTMIDRPNAVLVINPPNKDQGFLLPQLTSSERNAIAPTSPQDDGLVVFDTTDKSFYYWSAGSWIRGLGDSVTDALAYDAATQSLSLSAGGTVSLSSLKEIPLQTGQAGKFLTTDGTTLSWVTLSVLGDISSVTTGQALSGGATSGDINLSVNTDATTISVNGSNQLQLTNGAVTSPKLAPNAVNSTHIIDGTVSSADILDNTISTNDIVNGAVTGTKIASGTVTTTNISSGGNDKVLTTNGTGAVTWSDRTTFVDDNQNLALAGNTLNIDNGTGANLSNLNTAGDVTGTLSTLAIQPGAVNSSKIQDGSVAPADIATGGNSKVLTTDGTGAVNWADRSTFTDNQNLALAGNTLNIDNGTGANLSNLNAAGDVTGTLSTLAIQPGAVNSSKIQDGSVAPADIATGGNSKVLTTDGTGAVNWADRSTFTDNQNLGFSGNTLTIDNGTPVNLSAGGQVTGLLDNLVIQPGASNQVMTTNAAGTATVWTTPGGDVTGALNTTTVGRIQGRNVSNAAPNSGEALIWNGAAWVPTVVNPPTTQFYAVDPLHFQGSGSPITAGINLPDGATITGVTVYYEYTLLLGVINVTISRKEFANGSIDNISAGGTPLLGLGIQNIGLGVNGAFDVVDNSTYSYRITVTFSLPATQEIHGIRIQYTK